MPGWVVAGVADALAGLGWRSPMRSTAIRQLAADVVVRSDDAPRLLGFSPLGLEQMLDRWPSGVQERWFARLYFLKPLTLAILAIFWGASGLVGLFHQAAAAHVLTQVGFSEGGAGALVVLGALADLSVGALICARRSAPIGLLGALALTATYLAGASLYRPDLWTDPLGPLVKTVPAAALALVALAMMDER